MKFRVDYCRVDYSTRLDLLRFLVVAWLKRQISQIQHSLNNRRQRRRATNDALISKVEITEEYKTKAFPKRNHLPLMGEAADYISTFSLPDSARPIP